MSLILKRVELNNIRSHKHLVFEPSEDGVTAISGPNGSGKSTIVDSVAWALYGTKPKGVSRALAFLREGADLKTEKSFAEVEVELEQSTLKVQRRIVNKHGSVECEVWEMKHDEDDWTQIAGPAVSHAEPYIRKRLKMDEKGFLAAIFVQQKQVDQLIASGGRERAEVIEKLTGISSITAALVESRQQYNLLRRTLQFTSLDEDALQKLKDEKGTLAAAVAKDTAKRDALKKKLDTLALEVSNLDEKIKVEEENEGEIASLKEKIATANATITTLEEQLADINETKDAKKKQLTLVSKGSNLADVEKKLASHRNDLRQKDRVSNDLTRDEKHWKEKLTAYEEVIGKSSVKDLPGAEEGLKKAQQKLLSLTRKEASLTAERTSYLSQIKSFEKAVKVISSSDGSCPTCLQHVEDADRAVAVLEEEKATLQAKVEDCEEQLSTVASAKPRTEEAIEKFSSLVESISSLDECKATLATLSESRVEVESESMALEKEIAAVEKQHRTLKQQESIKNEYETLRQKAVTISDRLEKGKRMVRENTEKLKALEKLTGGNLPTLRRKYSTASSQRNEALEAFSELRESVSVMTTQVEHLEEKITAELEAISKYKDLMKSVEAAGNSVEIIEEFRENRIKTSVPIIGTYASDLLSRFTEGKFSQFKLDEKFDAIVVMANGTERPVGLLSGGELSAAAISLRLAISMLLNSGSAQNMIILDEVLVSQDAPRAEQILTTIKDVCQGQVLMISHGPYTNEIADKVVEL